MVTSSFKKTLSMGWPAVPWGRSRGTAPSDELGYALSQDYWGRGLMTEVSRELLRYGFEDFTSGASASEKGRRIVRSVSNTAMDGSFLPLVSTTGEIVQ